jgi:hypothetical protein
LLDLEKLEKELRSNFALKRIVAWRTNVIKEGMIYKLAMNHKIQEKNGILL